MTEEKYEVKEDVKPSRISSAYVRAPFDVAKAKLEKEGYRITSLEDSVNLMVNAPWGTGIDGEWVREGMLYIPNQGVYITKNSPVMDFPKEATQAHREGKDFYLTDAQVKKALEDSLKIGARSILIPLKNERPEKDDVFYGDTVINHFIDNPITDFIFGKQAYSFKNFLSGNMELKYLDMSVDKEAFKESEKPFVRQIWFGGTNFDAQVDGDGRWFDCGPLALHAVYEKNDKENGQYITTRGIKEVD